MTAIGGTAMGAAEYALRGLAQRADVRAHNVANLHTPGFRARQVDFESSLRAALRGEGLREPVTRVDPNLPNPNGSTVSLEGEMVGTMKDQLMRDAMVNAFNYKAGVLRAAIQGR